MNPKSTTSTQSQGDSDFKARSELIKRFYSDKLQPQGVDCDQIDLRPEAGVLHGDLSKMLADTTGSGGVIPLLRKELSESEQAQLSGITIHGATFSRHQPSLSEYLLEVFGQLPRPKGRGL